MNNFILPYKIGSKYKYQNHDEIFVLKEVSENKQVFFFDKNHSVTDNIFCDMRNVKTGIINMIGVQYNLRL